MYTKITYLDNAVLYVEAKGKLDIYSAYDYLDEVKEALQRTYVKELVLEFSEISYAASVGLRVILELYKIMQEQKRSLKLKNVNKEVLYAFKITGFDKFLTIENDSEDASENTSENTSDNVPD